MLDRLGPTVWHHDLVQASALLEELEAARLWCMTRAEPLPTELLIDRVGTRPTIITSQLPPTAWHAWLGKLTLTDAILDRVMHGVHRLALKGGLMRRSRAHAVGIAEDAMAEDTSYGG